MSTAFFPFLYRRRIPSGLLFVIHSINVCCLWDLLFAVILCLFFCCIRMYSILVWRFVLMFAIGFFRYILSHTLLAHMLCVCVQVVVRFAPPKHVPLLLLLPFCVCVWLICVFKVAQTLTIVPRVALNWYTVFVCWFYVSFSHKTFYGKQVWYLRITKYKLKLPSSTENILFLYFWFYFRWLQVCLCLCVGFF